MTLNDLIIKAYDTGRQLSSGDVPVILDGCAIDDMEFSIESDDEGGLYVQVNTIKH